MNDLCLNCFKSKEGYDVCPHCGFVNGTPPEQEFHLYPGTILNARYLVGTVLGFGGFGVTYKAWDLQLRSIVAIKEFFPAGLVNRVPGESEILVFDGTEKENYKEYLDRFMDEAKNLAQFNGKANIVNVFGFFEENNTAYFVMEYLDGISLKSYVEQNGRIPADTAVVIITDLLNGTSEVHSKGILHRDIAPDNIMLTNEGNVKILDFGSARFASEHSEKTLSAFIKPGYAAPEQYAAQGEQGVWTDIYGLGATMYYMVTGVRPDESTDRMVNDTVARPSELGIDLPVEVDKAIMKAIALQIDLRFKSTEEFLAAISGEYEIEYPDVELKKRKRKRAILAVVSAASIIGAVAFSIFMYNNLKVDPYESIMDGTKLEMWVYADNEDYQPGKSAMPDSFKAKVQENKEKQLTSQTKSYNDLMKNFASNISANYNKNVQVDVKVFENRQSYDAALENALKKNKLPDVFMVSDMYDSLEDKCMDLSDFTGIFANDDYRFISADNYGELYPGKKLIPLGFSTPVLYVNNALVSDYGIPDSVDKDVFEKYQDFENTEKYAGLEMVTGFSKGKQAKTRAWGIDESAYGEFVCLYSSPLTSDSLDVDVNESNTEFMNTLKSSYTANAFNKKVPISDYFYFGQLAYLVGDTSVFESVNNYIGGNFTVKAITNNGKAIVRLEDEIALNADLDENETLLARAFLEHLLSDDGQAYLGVIIGNSMPIQKKRLDEYAQLNENFGILNTEYNDAIVIGEKGLVDEKIAAQLYNNCYVGDEPIYKNKTVRETTESTTEIATESSSTSETTTEGESSSASETTTEGESSSASETTAEAGAAKTAAAASETTTKAAEPITESSRKIDD